MNCGMIVKLRADYLVKQHVGSVLMTAGKRDEIRKNKEGNLEAYKGHGGYVV